MNHHFGDQGASASRNTSRYAPCLDGYRALAAFAVLLTHVGYLTGHNDDGGYGAVSSRLDIGVTLFFILSGFLLYRPFAAAHLGGRRAPSTSAYLWRRVLRIVPAYWVVVTVAVFSVDHRYMRGAGSYAAQYLFANVYRPLHLLPGLEHTWSLAVEAAFYVVLPVIAIALRRPARRTPEIHARIELGVIALLGSLGLGYVAVVNSHHVHEPLTVLWLPAYLLWFAVGMALAVVSASREVCPSLWTSWEELGGATWWLLGGGVLVFWLATTPLTGPRSVIGGTAGVWPSVFRQLLYVLAAGLFLLPGLVGRQDATGWHRFLRSAPVSYLGRISYGVFLWHLLVLTEIYDLGGIAKFSGHFWLVLAITVSVTLVLAAASHHLLEEPIQRFRGRVVGRSTAIAPLPEPAVA